MHYRTGQILSTAYAAGSVHDFALFQQHRKTLPARAWVIADKGYQGIHQLQRRALIPSKATRACPVPAALKAINRAIQQRRILIEHVFAKLKCFRLLASRYRNRRQRFGLRFNLIAGIYNFELPKF